LRKGIVRFSNGTSLDVIRGNIYDIDESIVNSLLSIGWERVDNVKPKKEKIIKKEELVIKNDTKENDEGGDKKW